MAECRDEVKMGKRLSKMAWMRFSKDEGRLDKLRDRVLIAVDGDGVDALRIEAMMWGIVTHTTDGNLPSGHDLPLW